MILSTARIGTPVPDEAGMVLDITRGTAKRLRVAGATPSFGEHFAPPQAILDPVLQARREAMALRERGQIETADALEEAAWAAYKPRYIQAMRASWKDHRAAWEQLLAMPSVTFVCFCTNALRCHRLLLVGIVQKALKAREQHGTYRGDWIACADCGTAVLHAWTTMHIDYGRRRDGVRSSWHQMLTPTSHRCVPRQPKLAMEVP